MHRNQYLGMQIFKNFSEDDMPIVRCISGTLHLWYLTDAYATTYMIFGAIPYSSCQDIPAFHTLKTIDYILLLCILVPYIVGYNSVNTCTSIDSKNQVMLKEHTWTIEMWLIVSILNGSHNPPVLRQKQVFPWRIDNH